MSLEKTTLAFSTEIQFLEALPVEGNPMISKVKIRIAKPGQGNQFLFTKDVLESAAKRSLGLTPILTYYNHYKEDFGEHGQQAVYDKFGEFVTIGETKSVGVIPENPTIFWDEDDYLVTFGYLWTTLYKEVAQALEGRPQSMELSEENTIMRPIGDGRIEIIDTAFQALCILGDDVKPAFPGAYVASAMQFQHNDEGIAKINEGVSDFMTELKFALNNNFEDADLVVDVDGEERDAENRKKISVAIDTLDDVAEETEDPENIAKIDDAITVLVDAETEMKREADIIPATKAAQEALQGMPDGRETIVSVDNLSYKSKKSNSLLQPKDGEEDTKEEEEQVAIKKKKEQVVNPEEETVETKEETVVENPESEAVKKEVVAEDDKEPAVEEEAAAEKEEVVEETPSDNGEPEADNKGPEAAVATAAKADGTPADPEGAPESGEFIQASSEEETAAEIGSKRQTAASKRTSALLSELGDAEILEALADRIENTEEIKTRLTELLGASIQNELPGQEVAEPAGDIALEDTGNGEEPGVELPGEGAAPAEGEGDVAVDVEEEKEDIPAEETSDAEEDPKAEQTTVETAKVTKEEVPVEEDEDKKKKKPNFSLDELNFAEIISENNRLKKENQELLEFKLNVEKSKKEEILSDFADLSEESKDALRLQFNELSIEEVENKAIIAQYRETKNKQSGQKTSGDAIVFSSVEEEVSFVENERVSAIDALAQFLDASSKLQK